MKGTSRQTQSDVQAWRRGVGALSRGVKAGLRPAPLSVVHAPRDLAPMPGTGGPVRGSGTQEGDGGDVVPRVEGDATGQADVARVHQRAGGVSDERDPLPLV